MIIFHNLICGISITNPPTSLLFISVSLFTIFFFWIIHSPMYPNIDHTFFSTMTDHSDLFHTKENPYEDVSIKPDLPNCSQSSAISDLVVLGSSTRLENPISDLNQSWFTRRNSSQSHSTVVLKEKTKEGGEGYEAAGPLLFLLPKENFKLKVEEEKEEDGFRTPTSLDHRIPEVEQCPPAPIKPKPPLKRKASHTHSSTPLCLSSKELQLLFPVQHIPLLSDSHRIIKKVRRDDSKQ